VLIDIGVVEDALRAYKSPCPLGNSATMHSSQGLTIPDTIFWIIDNRIENSNLVYPAVSKVRRINQLRRVVLDYNDTTISDIVNNHNQYKNSQVINIRIK
jgi:hypothetical protein